jgi:4-amino-4-deoxy-L-arabinose transferase-like glycosyltransferase
MPLTAEETYHWNYARHPALSYHDHPPMIGWSIAPALLVFGDTRVGVRFIPLLLATGATILLARLARMMYGEAAATWTVFLVSIAPIILLMTGGGYPDSPLVFFWSLALFLTWKALDTGQGAWWIGAGAALGGAMLSKYTAVFFGLFVLIHLLFSSRDRRWLATPWPYLSAVVSLVVFSPVVYWNATHDWASFRYQGVQRIQDAGGFEVYMGFKFMGGQWLNALTLTLPLAVVAVARAVRSKREEDRYLFWSFAPMFGFFFLLGWTRSIHPQWPLPSMLGLTVLMAGAAASSEDRVSAFYRRARPWIAGVAAVALVGLAAHASFFLPWLSPLKGLYGWEEVAAKARELRGPGMFVIAVGRQYTVTSQLAYHLQAPYDVHGRNLLGVHALQYDHWSRPEELRDRDAVVVVEGDDRLPSTVELLDRYFRRVEPAGEVEVAVGRRPVIKTKPVKFALFVARG